MTVIICIQDRTTEQAASKVLIFFILKFRKKFLLFTVLRIEALDSLQHKSIHDFLIVIPIQTLVFQNFIKSCIVENNFLVQFSPQFTILFVWRSFAGHILLIYITLHDLFTQVFNEIAFIFPGFLLRRSKSIQLFVDFQLRNEAIFYKFHVGRQIFFGRNQLVFCCIQPLVGILGYLYHQKQKIVVQIIRFR